MKRLITTTALDLSLVGSTLVAASPAAPVSAKPCSTWWKVTGRKVAVRRPAPTEGPVATMHTRVDHYLHRGDRVRSCVVAIGRTASGPAYRACGRDGHVWRVVRGGQVPQTCLKRA
ncbi:hypothetical protein [Streptomyces ortus]|uniref:Secreted protein n=1 Tax=Streptomyces ortus TaxID=2867268 RepID=A0ABT3UW62_9ACTN|nr:hypothetical protein [Streptomyces ortus]MCX4231805.1 hypothetical protein [Streptomyces ortus]